jgi:hypothetical protein
MLKMLNKLINPAELFANQNMQYEEKIPLSDTLTAGQEKLCKTSISNIGHFLCSYITGTYETLYSVTVGAATHIVDDGICHLRGKLVDGAGQRQMFLDYVPFDLFLTGGRRRSVLATNNLLDDATFANRADPAPQLFYPVTLEYLFTANSDIQMYVKNDSNTTISFSLCFHGWRRKGK